MSLSQARDPGAPRISSAGRALDAVSALLGVCFERTYEGEPAMKLEAAARGGRPVEGVEAPVRRGSVAVVDTSRLAELVLGRLGDVGVRDLAYSVTYSLGRALGEVAVWPLGGWTPTSWRSPVGRRQRRPGEGRGGRPGRGGS